MQAGIYAALIFLTHAWRFMRMGHGRKAKLSSHFPILSWYGEMELLLFPLTGAT